MKNSPCYKDGNDCPKRTLHCHETCPEYDKYDKENKERLKSKRENDIIINYIASQLMKGKNKNNEKNRT